MHSTHEKWTKGCSSILLAIERNMHPYTSSFLARCCSFVFISPCRFSSSSLRKLGSHVPLERLLRQRGVGNRNEVKDLLKLGRVALENGQVLRRHRLPLRPDTLLFVNGKPVPQTPLLAVLYKPNGIQCSMKDDWDRPDLRSVVENNPILADKHPVGRLDADTSGLLLFSGSGSLTHVLVDPANEVEREYEALVIGAIDCNSNTDAAPLKQRLSQGVQTSDGIKHASLIECEVYDLARSQELISQHPLPYSHSPERQLELPPEDRIDMSTIRVSRLVLVVKEGKYRMVRRILANSGYPVIALHRTRFGHITLQPPAMSSDERGEQSLMLNPGMARLVTPAEFGWAVKLHDTVIEALKSKKAKERKERQAMCANMGVSNVDELNSAMAKMKEASDRAAARKKPSRQQQEIVMQALNNTEAKPIRNNSDSDSIVRAGTLSTVKRAFVKPKRSKKAQAKSSKSSDSKK